MGHPDKSHGAGWRGSGEVEEEVFAAVGFGFGGLLEGGLVEAGEFDEGSGEHVFDGEDLHFGEGGFGEGGRGVEAAGGGFLEHGAGGGFEGDEDADLGFFTVEYTAEVADVGVFDVAALYGENPRGFNYM